MNCLKCTVPTESNKQKKYKILVGIEKVTDPDPDPKSSVRSVDPEPYQNVKDPEYCLEI